MGTSVPALQPAQGGCPVGCICKLSRGQGRRAAGCAPACTQARVTTQVMTKHPGELPPAGPQSDVRQVLGALHLCLASPIPPLWRQAQGFVLSYPHGQHWVWERPSQAKRTAVTWRGRTGDQRCAGCGLDHSETAVLAKVAALGLPQPSPSAPGGGICAGRVAAAGPGGRHTAARHLQAEFSFVWHFG